MARAERQHIAAHGGEFLVGHMHEADLAALQEFDEPRRHERQIDHRQVHIDGAQHRHQMEDIRSALVVGQIELKNLNIRTDKLTQLCDAFAIGAITEPREQRMAINPDEVAAFDQAGFADLAGEREAEGF